jgi:replicative DNA helicase
MTQLLDSSIARQFERLPPHSAEAEMCVVASMMLNKEMIGEIATVITRDDFFQADHQIIFECLVKLYEQNRPVDAMIVREELSKRGLLDEIGGTAYLATVVNTVPSAAHGVHYAGIVREKSLLRQLISASNDILRDSYGPQESAELVLDKAEKRIFDIAQRKVSGAMVPMEKVLHEVFEMIESKGQRGVETGFYELDDMMNGLQNGEMIIVAARPSMGKAQPLDANVLTTAGWKPMGELAVGDALASVDGQPSTVAAIYPQGRRQVYRVTFADGRSTECCAEHLWRVYSPASPEGQVLSTDRLTRMLGDESWRGRLSVDRFTGHFGSDANLPIDPWLLGLLLGNARLGGVADDLSVDALALDGAEAGILAWAFAVGPTSVGNPDVGPALRPDWYGIDRSSPRPVGVALQLLGLAGKAADATFVPAEYSAASRDARLRLLAGLLGDEAEQAADGSVRFVTRSRRLAADAVDLARSVGGVGCLSTQGSGLYACELGQWSPAGDRRVGVVSIEPTRVTEAQCIAVTHPSRLYVTDDFVVTHNTAFAMNIVEHVAADGRLPVAVFSLEMSKQQLAQRMLCSRGQIDAHKLRRGMLQAHDYQHLANVVGELAKAPIWVDDSPGLTILDLRAKARRLKMQQDVKLIMIDYMQLMDNPGVESRQQQISEISRGIKAVARELNVPVICLSQLNRGSEGRDGHRPRMSDLRESGSIEQDADVVALLHREDYYRMSEPDFQPDNVAEVIIAKQRNGPTGTVKLAFMNKTTRFENLSTQNDPF